MGEQHLGLEPTLPAQGRERGCWFVCLKSLFAVSPLRMRRYGSHLPLGPQSPVLGRQRPLGSTFQMDK